MNKKNVTCNFTWQWQACVLFKPTTTYLRCYYICIALNTQHLLKFFLRKEMTPAVERRLPRLEMYVMPGLDTFYKWKLPICLWNVIHCVLWINTRKGL